MNKEVIKNIEKIYKEGLCTTCGMCAGICPKNAVQMIKDKFDKNYYPKINKKLCDNCGICFEICPGHTVNFQTLNLEIFDKKNEDLHLGNYQNCYIGHANDVSIRYNAASGGMVTALLLYALEKGIIDGALVTKMKEENPLEPKPFIARTREEIISACKSKYCPVPTNAALKEILKEDGKFAVVGLPCHIHGIRKGEKIIKKLKEKIVICIGIFCSHNDNFWQTKFLLNKLGIKEENVKRIDYRGEGWPGKMSIFLKNGRKVMVPYSDGVFLHGLWFYALPRCTLCCDLTSELADVSCGDAWLPKILATETIGKSIVISRSRMGENLCQKAVQDGYMEIEKLEPYKVKQSGDMMRTKKKDIVVRFYCRKLFNKTVPNYNTVFLKPGFISYLRSAIIYFNLWVSSKKYLQRLISFLSTIESFTLSHLQKS